ncbi:MAG: hypothetical protein A2091_07360 [Desulfuromonadales bacterium GWD2_61_12]|nr:MAG: hypothetical protein A2005_06935 [Desulfuromonadales bacterium GWC2_61_20]OGR36344.1 MAG: hypothetical protein A2091_07360 [Desulfuromonadales bacterium GWD2_61_12]HAD05201.1 hypothetical protein [Desulfuromonas sp.]HBT83479.1 hypothetical protein [Desulfuromonas sp.]
MCMDMGPYFLIRGDEEISLENVSSVIAGNGKIKLVDVYGKTEELAGAVAEIDLLNRRIVLA